MDQFKIPAVVLTNPKFAHNVGGAIRACAAFGIPTLLWTGNRVNGDTGKDRMGRHVKTTAAGMGMNSEHYLNPRLPREERMREYKACVTWARSESTDVLTKLGGTPVAVEISKGALPLPLFEHPEDAVYVFGPEDGSVSKAIRHVCHHFVVIPTGHCLNLAAAINVVLFDRRAKRQRLGLEPMDMERLLDENRGWERGSWEDDD